MFIYSNCMFPYLGFCRVFSFLFFLLLLGFLFFLLVIDRNVHVVFQIRPRLIIISFLVDKSPALDISFNEAHMPRIANLFSGEAFTFLSVFSGWHDFGIWVSSVSQIMCLRSSTNKQQLVSFRSLKNNHVLAFWQFISPNQSWSLWTSLCWRIHG